MADTMKINVHVENENWLFGDLKRHFAATRVPGIEVKTSHKPLPEADAWVAIRTHEAAASPDPARTVACIHDLYHHDGMYTPEGLRGVVHRTGGLVLCHPRQRAILEEAGVDLKKTAILERPLGATAAFVPRTQLPPVFTIGWVGRNHWRKRLDWLEPIAHRLQLEGLNFRIMLVGLELEAMAAGLTAMGVDTVCFPRESFPASCYPDLYQQMDCLLITSATEAGPLTLFEALATGLGVVSTKVGWAPAMASRSHQAIRLAETPQGLAQHLMAFAKQRETLLNMSRQTSALMHGFRLESWFPQVLSLAAGLVRSADPAKIHHQGNNLCNTAP